jgi:alpha-glucosidase (family GH31 glycosyl hydrolase)
VLPLYVRDNSIIPMGPDIAYIGEKSTDPITLEVWLSSYAECRLYDDDEKARTQEIVACRASKTANQIALSVGASTNTFIAKFNKTSRPKHVTLNGKDIPHLASLEALEKAQLGWHYDPSSVVRAKFSGSASARELLLHFQG